MKIKQNLVSSNKYNIKCPYIMKPEYITFHNTDNDAPAKNEVSYMIGNNNQVSFHVAVDDIEAIQGIPFDRNAWHCSDGSTGSGNRKSIGVEICYSKLGKNNSKFKKAEENAVVVCANLLKQFNLGIDRLKPHKFWSGKNCPGTTNHQEFINRVKVKLEELNNPKPIGTQKYSVLINSYSDIVKARTISHMIKEDDNLFNEVIPFKGKYAIKIYPLSPREKAEGIQKLVKEKYNAYSDIISI